MSSRTKGLSKSRIISHQQCPKRLWLQIYKKDQAEVSPDAARVMVSGTSAGEVAQQMYPEGVVVDAFDISQSIEVTKQLLSDGCPIFEAALQFDGVLVFVDMLVPDEDGFHLIEVKSSTKVKDYHIADTAIQTWVAQQSGLNITKSSVAVINNQFVYPGSQNYEGLFCLTDISEKIRPLLNDVQAWVAEARETLGGDEPNISIGEQCKKPFPCPFIGYCSPPQETLPLAPLSDLPNSRKLIAELTELGYDDLANVPVELLTSPIHRRIQQSVLADKPYLSNEVAGVVSNIAYPRYYLDFETIQFAVPIWAGTKPYQQVPFQWSCHIETELGQIEHHEFLADGKSDSRFEFASSLVGVLGDSGAIIAYNAGFEKMVMRQLYECFPEFIDNLVSAIGRTVDLLPIARNHYYHPAMRGSWSIKYVLPTIAPELSYDGMAVANGVMAQDTFRDLMEPNLSEGKIKEMREALLRYCEKDTYAMVKIAHFFTGR